jgi:hypothetical protein
MTKISKRISFILLFILPFNWYWYAAEAGALEGAEFFEGRITGVSCHRLKHGARLLELNVENKRVVPFKSENLGCDEAALLKHRWVSGYWKRFINSVTPVEVKIDSEVVHPYSLSRFDHNIFVFLFTHLMLIWVLIVIYLRAKFRNIPSDLLGGLVQVSNGKGPGK